MNRGTAVITGASSGIGAATAIALANEGWHVLAGARRLDKLNELAKQNANIEPFELDVTEPASVARLDARMAQLDVTVLFANAGGSFDVSWVKDADIESWIKTYDVNVIGAVRTIKVAIPHLIKSGRGSIVLTSSTAARVVYEGGGSYTAAKHGAAALAETLRLELCGEPVRVIELAPGLVKTEEFTLNRVAGNQEAYDKVYAGVAEPLTAEDVAEAVRWSVVLPHHFNVDLMVIRPIAQAAAYKLHRVNP